LFSCYSNRNIKCACKLNFREAVTNKTNPKNFGGGGNGDDDDDDNNNNNNNFKI